MKPEGFATADIYVCESRYATRSRMFKKIKLWIVKGSTVKYVAREVPLPVVRVASMFAKPNLDKYALAYTDCRGFVEKVSLPSKISLVDNLCQHQLVQVMNACLFTTTFRRRKLFPWR